MLTEDIEKYYLGFREKSLTTDRYSSFDFCYNYFYHTKNLLTDTEKSCLVLGFYLASWGMYRGSSFILDKSLKHLESTIIYINELKLNQDWVWEIDVDKYDKTNIDKIIEIYGKIKKQMIEGKNADVTLVSKIMLGVFGFVPAFDNNFSSTFREIYKGDCGFRSINVKSLNLIKTFYDSNKDVIDYLSNKTKTKDFLTGDETELCYPKAKIIDMYGFMKGKNSAENNDRRFKLIQTN